LPNQLLLVAVLVVAGENFEQVVFAVLLGKEKPRPVCPEFSRPDQSVNRAVSLGHVHTGRFVILFPWDAGHPVLPERDKSGHNVSVRMLSVQFVSPNRIELIELIVQRVAAIFCHQDRVPVVHKRDVIECSMVGVAQDYERDISSLAAYVEIDTEDSAESAARCQLRLYSRAIICVAGDVKEECPKM
jgi:hypothetical protein